MKIEHYVEWLVPGFFFPEESNQKIKTRELSKLKIPRDAYAFTFYDIKTVDAVDEEGKPHKITTTINKSSRYIIGEIFTLEEIIAASSALPGKYRILASNIESYETKSGVKTHLGNWQPLLKDDTVLSRDGVKFTKPVFRRGDG